MSSPDRPGGRQALLEALQVRRNAKRGFAAGLAFTAGIFLFFVVLAPGTTRSTVYYVALAVVLALTVSGLATAVLVGMRAYRLTKEL